LGLRVLSVVGVATALAAASLLGAGNARADGSVFDQLRSEITSSSLPAAQQRSFLERVSLAESALLPLDPAVPPRPCAATAQLDGIGFSHDTIVYGFDYPPSPCRVSFLDTVPSGN